MTGDPVAGSLSLNAAFTALNQTAMLGRTLSVPLDITGKILKAQFRIDQVFTNPNNSMEGTIGSRIYVQTGSGYLYSSGDFVNGFAGGWMTMIFDPMNPSYRDTSTGTSPDFTQIRNLGIEISSLGQGPTGAASVHLDSFSVQAAPAPNEPPWTFDCHPEGFAVTYHSDPSLAPTLTWMSSPGNPSPGALRLNASFSAPSQYVGVGLITPTTGFLDLSNKTLSAKVRLISGFSTSGPLGAAQLYVATGDAYVCGMGSPVTLSPGDDWVTLTLPPSSPYFTCPTSGAPYDPSKVGELGIQFFTDSTGTFVPAIIDIDTITAEP
jgi:hypothetical protein